MVIEKQSSENRKFFYKTRMAIENSTDREDIKVSFIQCSHKVEHFLGWPFPENASVSPIQNRLSQEPQRWQRTFPMMLGWWTCPAIHTFLRCSCANLVHDPEMQPLSLCLRPAESRWFWCLSLILRNDKRQSFFWQRLLGCALNKDSRSNSFLVVSSLGSGDKLPSLTLHLITVTLGKLTSPCLSPSSIKWEL